MLHGERYLTGPQLLRWAAALGPITSRVDVVTAIVQDTAAQTGEAVGLAEYDPLRGTAVMRLVASGPTPLQYGLATGVDMPLHAGAAGKAILAHLPEATIGDLKLEKFTERTITTKTELAEQLPKSEEGDEIGIAVPYFIDGTVAGSITATVPRFRATHIDTDKIVTALTRPHNTSPNSSASPTPHGADETPAPARPQRYPKFCKVRAQHLASPHRRRTTGNRSIADPPPVSTETDATT